ncbi:MAG: Flp pilus assembly protein CpaB [Solirubrobacterales bacterium]
MSRRRRALGFGLAALVAALAAATIADRYGRSVARGYGELRPVVVAATRLRRGQPIDPAAGLLIRRVPARFVPPGALADPGEAVGLVPTAPLAAGSYLVAGQLRAPPAADGGATSLGRGRRPVEIAVSGAAALSVAGGSPAGSRVDVVVTTEPSSSSGGRTFVAAAAVPLLALSPTADGAGTAAATLGLTRAQALRLIAAESFARQITILPLG